MLALSEVNWSPLELKNYADFQKRLSAHFPRLDKQNVNYRIPEPKGLRNVLFSNEKDSAEINLSSLVTGGKIFYTIDGSEPTEKSNLYKSPLKLKLEPNQKINLKTVVVNKKGRKSSIYGATVWRYEFLKAVGNYRSITNGMIFSFFKGEFKSIGDFESSTPADRGVMESFDLKKFGEKTNFGVVWEAYLKVPATEIYEFQMESAGGAVLTIDNEKTIDAESLHEKKITSGDVALYEGFHHFKLAYFQATGEPILQQCEHALRRHSQQLHERAGCFGEPNHRLGHHTGHGLRVGPANALGHQLAKDQRDKRDHDHYKSCSAWRSNGGR